ncbi:MAG TPA: Glu/Leu/Phe/Val dehydrogenase dimerization domain-containing protein [Thermoanaerobaculia bacterium]|jgi:glutamate dehydrogenase/leucine dehydrogenase
MLWNETPQAFAEALRGHGLTRAWVVTRRTGEVEASHRALAPLAEAVAAAPDYGGHEGCFFEIGGESGHLLAAFVHRTRRGQAAGGVRFWSYPTLGDLVTDGLRLSLAMGQKSALAGLWWGGGKGVIARRPGADHRDRELRRRVYRDYGRFLSGLAGCYVAAEDVGTTPEDMAEVHVTTRHTTCVPPAVGGSGNPSRLTATGVVVAMEAALDHLGLGGLAGKTVAMQGLGNVASFMIGELTARGVGGIVGADVDAERLDAVRRRHPETPLELAAVAPGDASILAAECDVLAPNAVGAVLNPETIPTIRAPIVCGAANNQLAETRRDAAALQARGVVWVPDFLANRMGIVSCANEQYGVFEGDPAVLAHLDRDAPHGIFRRTSEVLRRAEESGTTPAEEAERLAGELAGEPHPIWPDRGRQIIDDLVASGWGDNGREE